MSTNATNIDRRMRNRSPLDRLLAGIHGAMSNYTVDADRARAVAHVLQPSLGDPALLPPERCRSSPDGYRSHLVHVADDGAFSVVALVWRPGQRTPVHSHRSWCVVGVHHGIEREIGYEIGSHSGPPELQVTTNRCYRSGEVTWLPDGDGGIHAVENTGRTLAISIHVYALDYRLLGSSILHTYPTPGRNHALARADR